MTTLTLLLAKRQLILVLLLFLPVLFVVAQSDRTPPILAETKKLSSKILGEDQNLIIRIPPNMREGEQYPSTRAAKRSTSNQD